MSKLAPWKLSPSKFHFGFDNCQRCYCLDIKEGITQPSSFPGVFSKFDRINGNIISVPGLDIGKRGLEKFFDLELRGKFGRKRNEVTSKGHIIDSQIYEKTKSGKDIQVSLDMRLQAFVIERLERGNHKLTSINNKIIADQIKKKKNIP